MLLQNLQVEFAESLMEADQPLSFISPPVHVGIYRNNITSNFMNVLKETYPLLRQLLGEDCFCALAKKYTKQYPSCSSNLHDYGEYFGSFIEAQPILQHLVYLNEVAQFEWATHRIFFAADAISFDPIKLKNLSPEQYSALHFVLHPASELLTFQYPILKIIDLCHGHIEGTVDIREDGVNLLIIRQELDIKLIPLSSSEFIFLQALQKNACLQVALDAAMENEAHFDLEERLVHWIKNKTIVDCYL